MRFSGDLALTINIEILSTTTARLIQTLGLVTSQLDTLTTLIIPTNVIYIKPRSLYLISKKLSQVLDNVSSSLQTSIIASIQ